MISVSPDKALDYAQKVDPNTGLVMPWYTHGALDDIQGMDLEDKVVFEWGGGCSTFWWSRVCKRVYTTEAHQEWADWIGTVARSRGFDNVSVTRRWPDPLDEYLKMPDERVDIVCIDGSARTECLEKALTLPRPLTIIFDNWQQDGVYLDEKAEEMMSRFSGRFYIQADHKDHQGRPWQTAIWLLP